MSAAASGSISGSRTRREGCSYEACPKTLKKSWEAIAGAGAGAVVLLGYHPGNDAGASSQLAAAIGELLIAGV